MNARRASALVLFCSVLGVSVSTPSQVPSLEKSAADPAASQGEALAKPRNLRVSPKDSSPADIKTLMDGYGRELGVKCDYCHAQDPRTQKLGRFSVHI
jgi:hypothetical protein